MARSRPRSNPLPACAAALLALASTHGTSAAGLSGDSDKCNDPIDVSATSIAGDYKNNTTQWNNVVVTQCAIRVEAKKASATGLNSENTRWTFDGDVRINVEKRGSLSSSQAIVDVRNNQIAKATITGSPAEFEQRNADTNVVTRGHAGEIVYEVGAGTVKLTNDAWLRYGTTDMKGSSFIYDIREEKVQAGATQPGAPNNERVHIRITPKKTTTTVEPEKGSSGNSASGTSTPAPTSPATPPRTP
jgi:lipopolysaccharide transport protein LptA